MKAKPKAKKAAPAKRAAKKVAKQAAATPRKAAKKAVAKSAAKKARGGAVSKKVAAKRAAPTKRPKAMSNDTKLEVFKRFVREHHDKYLKDPNITAPRQPLPTRAQGGRLAACWGRATMRRPDGRKSSRVAASF